MNRHFRRLLFLLNVGGLTIILAVPSLALPQGVLWGKQYASGHDDIPVSIQVEPDGNIVVVGNSDSDERVETATGTQFFITKFRPDGRMLWRTQVKAGLYAEALAVTIDSASHIYIAGRVDAPLFGKQLGDMDAFVGKWSADGKLIWGRQFGTNAQDEANCVALGYLGQIYVGGFTSGSLYNRIKDQGLNNYLVTYSRDGQLIAGRQYPDDVRPLAMAFGGDQNLYVAAFLGSSMSEQAQPGALLLKYNSSMHVEWSRSPQAPSQSSAIGISVSGDSIYVVGRAYDGTGERGQPAQGTYLTRFNTHGKRKWIKTWHRDLTTTFASVAADSQGSVYVAGYEALTGQSLIRWALDQKAIISCVGSDGHERWARSFGAKQRSGITGLFLSHKHLYATGFTNGDLFGKWNGRTTLFLAEVKR